MISNSWHFQFKVGGRVCGAMFRLGGSVGHLNAVLIFLGGHPAWSVSNWRMSELASQYWEAVNRIAIWEEFKSKTAGESLKFSLELLK